MRDRRNLVDKNKKKHDGVMGIFVVSFLHISLQLLLIYDLYSYFFPTTATAFYEYLLHILGKIKTHKGIVNSGFVLLTLILSLVIAYGLCCFRVPKSSIPERLNKHSFLRNHSYWKEFALVIVYILFIRAI
ncbi:hypothetical protein [Catenovulum sediminis]|uniref:hypothetical protein n=1 Tax=Catenovulum sediminis TaxID=1740262 RepID=UPI00117C1161|nr:hypothetical protein [Catenovulum sediminis]